MKLLDFDWQLLVGPLPVWSSLSPASRWMLQDSPPGAPIQLAPFGADGSKLAAARILKPYTDGLRAAATDEARPFLALVRLLRRAPLLAQPSLPSLKTYLGEVFSADERGGLGRGTLPSWGSDERIANELTLERHVRSFVEAPNSSEWEENFQSDAYHAYRRDRPQDAARFRDKEVAEAARRLAKLLMDRPEPIPLLDVLSSGGGPTRAVAARAALGLVRYAVAFVAERPSDGVVVLTLWPSVSARLHRKTAPAPAVLTPTGDRSSAFGVEDLETVLLEIAREPLRVRVQDGVPFEKRRREISDLFPPQPTYLQWIHDRLVTGEFWRLSFALEHARLFGWLRLAGTGGKPAYTVTDAARTWLGNTASERQNFILDALRATPERAAPPPKKKKAGKGRAGDASRRAPSAKEMRFAFSKEDDPAADPFEDDDLEFDEIDPERDGLTFLVPWRQPLDFPRQAEAAAGVVAAFADLPVGEFFDIESFLRHHAEERNPIATVDAAPYLDESSIEEREDAWRVVLFLFLHTRLLAFGAAVASDHGPERRGAFALTSGAPYLFGQSDVRPIDDTRHESVRVVVQPNFEIVFPTPAPGIEARLVAFAERAPTRAGTTLRITRASVSAAAYAGMSADAVLEMLAAVSLNPIPRNVEREVRGWMEASRTLEVEEIQIVRCPDHDTALRLITAAGNGARLLGESVVELPSGAKLAALVRKIRANGFFLTPRAGAKTRRRH